MMFACYTGASFGLKPFEDDFVGYMECDIPVEYVTKVNKAIAVGENIHKFKIARVMMYTFPVCRTVYQRLILFYSFLRLLIICTAVKVLLMLTWLKLI